MGNDEITDRSEEDSEKEDTEEEIFDAQSEDYSVVGENDETLIEKIDDGKLQFSDDWNSAQWKTTAILEKCEGGGFEKPYVTVDARDNIEDEASNNHVEAQFCGSGSPSNLQPEESLSRVCETNPIAPFPRTNNISRPAHSQSKYNKSKVDHKILSTPIERTQSKSPEYPTSGAEQIRFGNPPPPLNRWST